MPQSCHCSGEPADCSCLPSQSWVQLYGLQPHIHGEVRGVTGAERDTRQPGPTCTFQARWDKQQHSHSHGSWRPQRIPGPHPSQVTNCWGHPLPAPHWWGPHPAQEPCLPRALPGTQRPGTCLPRSALGEHRALLQARASPAADTRSARQGTATAQPHCCQHTALPFPSPSGNRQLTLSLLQARAVSGQRGCLVAPQLSWGSALGSRTSGKGSAAQCLG